MATEIDQFLEITIKAARGNNRALFTDKKPLAWGKGAVLETTLIDPTTFELININLTVSDDDDPVFDDKGYCSKVRGYETYKPGTTDPLFRAVLKEYDVRFDGYKIYSTKVVPLILVIALMLPVGSIYA